MSGGGPGGGIGGTPGDTGTGQGGIPGMGEFGGGPEDPLADEFINRASTVSWDQSDLEALGAFDVGSVPQYLIDRGLIDPFEFKPPSVSTYSEQNRYGKEGNYKDATYMSPSEFKNKFQYDYNSYPGNTRPEVALVDNWLKEMQSARQNQYAQWTHDFGQFLGGAGTRLASRFDTKKAQINKETLLAGTK